MLPQYPGLYLLFINGLTRFVSFGCCLFSGSDTGFFFERSSKHHFGDAHKAVQSSGGEDLLVEVQGASLELKGYCLDLSESDDQQHLHIKMSFCLCETHHCVWTYYSCKLHYSIFWVGQGLLCATPGPQKYAKMCVCARAH